MDVSHRGFRKAIFSGATKATESRSPAVRPREADVKDREQTHRTYQTAPPPTPPYPPTHPQYSVPRGMFLAVIGCLSPSKQIETQSLSILVCDEAVCYVCAPPGLVADALPSLAIDPRGVFASDLGVFRFCIFAKQRLPVVCRRFSGLFWLLHDARARKSRFLACFCRSQDERHRGFRRVVASQSNCERLHADAKDGRGREKSPCSLHFLGQSLRATSMAPPRSICRKNRPLHACTPHNESHGAFRWSNPSNSFGRSSTQLTSCGMDWLVATLVLRSSFLGCGGGRRGRVGVAGSEAPVPQEPDAQVPGDRRGGGSRAHGAGDRNGTAVLGAGMWAMAGTVTSFLARCFARKF